METIEGTEVVSVRSVPGGRGYHAPGLYRAVRRVDGTLTWRLVEHLTGQFYFQGRRMRIGYRSPAKAARIGAEMAAARGVAYVDGVRHGRVAS